MRDGNVALGNLRAYTRRDHVPGGSQMWSSVSATVRADAIPFALMFASTAAWAGDYLSVVQSHMAAWNVHDSATAAGHMAENVR
jgi:hypothetical protein